MPVYCHWSTLVRGHWVNKVKNGYKWSHTGRVYGYWNWVNSSAVLGYINLIY